tara:strand:- start:411 stop:647 length:237 start_codon:yes stop_codon:yes gene_type:complete
MGFILKLVFIYFLFKFLWSISRERIIKKMVKFINKKINSQMGHRHTAYKNDPLNSKQQNVKNNENQKDTFDADYKVIK